MLLNFAACQTMSDDNKYSGALWCWEDSGAGNIRSGLPASSDSLCFSEVEDLMAKQTFVNKTH